MTAINFPASPTTGDTFVSGDVTYTWDGVKWTAKGADPGHVKKAGDTMTGNLTVPSLNTGQLAGFRNVLINGNLTINQRGVDIAAAATGSYGQDRWKKTAGGMTQIIEEGSFEPGATYTLSGTGVTTQQLTAPASGNWTLPDIPVTARKIQLEPGPVATPFEHRPIGTELALCQRYYQVNNVHGTVICGEGGVLTDDCMFQISLPNPMRVYSPTYYFRKGGVSIGAKVLYNNKMTLGYDLPIFAIRDAQRGPASAFYKVTGTTGDIWRVITTDDVVLDAEL